MEKSVEFPFKDVPNIATITCCHVIEDDNLIAYVSHDEDDGMWQFLCGRKHSENEARLVSLVSVYEKDNSVGILAFAFEN